MQEFGYGTDYEDPADALRPVGQFTQTPEGLVARLEFPFRSGNIGVRGTAMWSVDLNEWFYFTDLNHAPGAESGFRNIIA